ncbi:MAG TPA: cell division protein FtsL [Clostridia bacterium]|nr:cell division protein FtsL [Clostridia bacterium]
MTSVAYKRYIEYDFNEVSVNPSRRKNKKKKTFYATKLFMVVVLTGLLFISILFGYAAISEIKYQVYEHKQAMNDLQIKIEKNKIELEAMNKTSIIEDKAVHELGMKVPERQQIVYINAKGEESGIKRVSIAAQSVESAERGFIGNIYSSILSLGFMGD